ncbi:MAG: DMT family transporter [Planctomycetes bacterium]|nr:DMT family transporter [Planctomycetota bacterium]
MQRASPSLAARIARLEPALLGVACGLLAAVGYTASNICLRAVSHLDPVWVSAVKAFPTFALFGPWLIFLAVRGERVFPPLRVLASLMAAGLVAQLGGNVLFQWSLGVIGIAAAVPVTLGAMIIAGATLGRVFLHEPITPRNAVAGMMLLAAIFILSYGARGVAELDAEMLSDRGWWTALGVGAAFTCGIAYAALGVVIRYGVSGRARVTTTVVSISFVGLVSLGTASLIRVGPEGIFATPPEAMATMVFAGVFNAMAFLALTKSLQLVSVLLVNALNASQAAMALAAGVIIFGEPLTAGLVIGVATTAAGLVVMGGRGQKRSAALIEK